MKENKTFNIVLLVFIVGAFTYAGIDYYLRGKALNNAMETTATVVEVFKGNAYRGEEFKIIYHVDYKQYYNWHTQRTVPYKLGDKVKILYSIDNPKYARIKSRE